MPDTIVITGANRGIGLSFAKIYKKFGCEVYALCALYVLCALCACAWCALCTKQHITKHKPHKHTGDRHQHHGADGAPH